MLNAIWIGFLLVALAGGFWEATFGGRPAVLGEMTRASFEMAKTIFEGYPDDPGRSLWAAARRPDARGHPRRQCGGRAAPSPSG